MHATLNTCVVAPAEEYVTCHTCRSPETILQKDTRLYFLQCETCHSRCSVASIKTGFQAVTGKRAQLRAKANWRPWSLGCPSSLGPPTPTPRRAEAGDGRPCDSLKRLYESERGRVWLFLSHCAPTRQVVKVKLRDGVQTEEADSVYQMLLDTFALWIRTPLTY